MATAKKQVSKVAQVAADADSTGGNAKPKGAGKKARPAIEGEPTLSHVLERLAVVEKKLDKVLRLVKPAQ